MTKPKTYLHRRVSTGLAALLCATLLAAGCKKAEPTPVPEVYVQASRPAFGSIAEVVTADAILAPLAQAAISPKITAPVKNFYVQRGAHVRAGQLLATLENSDLAAAAMDNQGSFKVAQATYETETKATVPEDLTKARLDLAQAKATLDLDRSIVNSRTQLLAQGAIAGRDLDTARETLTQAQAAFDIANQHLQSVEKVGNKAALASAQGNLQSAKGKLLGAEATLNYSEIRSPVSGVITDRPLFAGETASAGTPLITVMDTSALIAKLHIAQAQAQQLALGAQATLAVPGIADPVPAKVSLISPALDPGSTTVEVWLRVENSRGDLKVGTPVHVTMAARHHDHVLILPANAIQTDADGSKFVLVIAPDSTAHKKSIVVGLQTAANVEVASGLTQSDVVITSGAYGLDESTHVKIGTDPSANATGSDSSSGGSGQKDADDK